MTNKDNYYTSERDINNVISSTNAVHATLAGSGAGGSSPSAFEDESVLSIPQDRAIFSP